MYITGTVGNFVSRMHQLTTGIVDLSGAANTYWNEGKSYAASGIISTGTQYQYSHVFASKFYSVTKTGIQTNLNYFRN